MLEGQVLEGLALGGLALGSARWTSVPRPTAPGVFAWITPAGRAYTTTPDIHAL